MENFPYFALGLTILVHLFGTVWWASSKNTRMKHLEDKTRAVDDLNVKMASLETTVNILVQTTQQTNTAVNTLKEFLLTNAQKEAQRLKQNIHGGDE